MTDTTEPETSGDKTPEDRTLADWMRITQRAFMRRVAQQIEDADVDMRAAMAAKFHGHPSPEADKLTAAVKAVQDRATAAVPADDLAATLRTLEAIARELGWDETQQTGRGFGPGFGRGPWGGGWGGWGFDPRRSFGRGFGGHSGRGHHGHHDGGDHPKRERAYERGFEAGFDAARRHNPAA